MRKYSILLVIALMELAIITPSRAEEQKNENAASTTQEKSEQPINVALRQDNGSTPQADPNLCEKRSNECVTKRVNAWRAKNKHLSKDYVIGNGNAIFQQNSPQYADALNSAYQIALLDAYSKIANKQASKIETKIIREFTNDNRENPDKDKQTSSDETGKTSTLLKKASAFLGLSSEEEIELGEQTKVLTKKVAALAEATLDEKLAELGQDPSNFKNCTETQKRALLKNSIESKALQTAAAETSSMLPVQTFVACDKNGSCSVAVAVSTKVKTFNLIKDIQKYGSQYKPNPNMPDTYTQLQNDIDNERDFSDDFGVRLLYDAEGYPVFVSFGQSSMSMKGGEDLYSDNYEAAMEYAESMATSYLGTLFDSYTTYSREVNVSAVKDINEIKQTNYCANTEDKRELSQKSIDKELKKYVDLKSKTVLTGIVTLYQWHQEYDQTETVGVIVMWSPKTAQDGENLRNRIDTSSLRESNIDHGKPFAREGINLDVYDF